MVTNIISIKEYLRGFSKVINALSVAKAINEAAVNNGCQQ